MDPEEEKYEQYIRILAWSLSQLLMARRTILTYNEFCLMNKCENIQVTDLAVVPPCITRGECATVNADDTWIYKTSIVPMIGEIMRTEGCLTEKSMADERMKKLFELSLMKTHTRRMQLFFANLHNQSVGLSRTSTYNLEEHAQNGDLYYDYVPGPVNKSPATWELSAGPLCDKMQQVVEVQVRRWLLAVYMQLRQMMKASDSNGSICVNKSTSRLIDTLSRRISSSATISKYVDEIERSSDPLTRTALTHYGDEILKRDRDEEKITQSRRAVSALYVLASSARDGDSVRSALLNKACEIREELLQVVACPPHELVCGTAWKRSGIGLLTIVVNDPRNTEVRVRTAQRWQQEHGAYAVQACVDAMNRLEAWLPLSQPYISTLQLFNPSRTDGNVLVSPTHVCFGRTYKISPLVQRTGLSTNGECKLRMLSILQELVGHGELSPGGVSAGIVSDVTTHCATEAAEVHALIHQEIKHRGLGLGKVLQETRNELQDPQGDLSSTVASVSHALSMYKLKTIQRPIELLDSANPLQGNGFDLSTATDPETLKEIQMSKRIVTDVGRLLSDMLPARIYPSEMSFPMVIRGMRLLVDAIGSMRNRIGTNHGDPCNQVISGLMMVEAIRQWQPDKGELVIQIKKEHQLPVETKKWLAAFAGRVRYDPERRGCIFSTDENVYGHRKGSPLRALFTQKNAHKTNNYKYAPDGSIFVIPNPKRLMEMIEHDLVDMNI